MQDVAPALEQAFLSLAKELGGLREELRQVRTEQLTLCEKLAAIEAQQRSAAHFAMLNSVCTYTILAQQSEANRLAVRQNNAMDGISQQINAATREAAPFEALRAEKRQKVSEVHEATPLATSASLLANGIEKQRAAKRDAMALQAVAEQLKAKEIGNSKSLLQTEPSSAKTIVPGKDAEMSWCNQWLGLRPNMSDYESLQEILDEWETGVVVKGTDRKTIPLRELEREFVQLPSSEWKKCKGWRSGRAMRSRLLDMKRIIYFAQRQALKKATSPREELELLEQECTALPGKKALATKAEYLIKERDPEATQPGATKLHEAKHLSWVHASASDEDGHT